MKRGTRHLWIPWLLSILCLWLFLNLLPAQAKQQNAPDPPATYYGLLQAGSGFSPTSGMSVTAWISGTLCGHALSQASSEEVVYTVNVEADWDAAPGCGAPGREIRFTVAGYPMQPLALWDNSQVHALDLSPGDVVPPQIINVLPANGTTDVTRNTPVVVDFSESMLTSSVSTLVTPTVGGLVEVWSNGDTRLTLDHDDFDASTRYTVTVAGSDLAGNLMASPYTWAFTTSAEVSPEADLSLGKVREGGGVVTAGDAMTYTFTVTNSGPTEPVTAIVVDTFSDASALATIGGSGCIWSGAATVTCTVASMISTPSVVTLVVTTSDMYSGTLSNSATVVLTGDVVDPDASNNNAGPVLVSVHTLDTTPPFVVAVNPAAGSQDVAPDAAVIITFSESIDSGTFAYTVVPDPGGWSALWQDDNTVAVLSHNAFASTTCYTVTVTAADDLTGNPLMGTPYVWSFTTADVTPPTVIGVSPGDGTTNVVRNAPIVVDFSEAIATGSVNTLISPTVGGLVATWSSGDTRLTLNHDNFDAGTRYTITVAGSDMAGNPMVSPYTWAFTTGTEIAPEADLSLGKVREGSGVVAAGHTITYTFTITNSGPTVPVTATVVDIFSDVSALAGISGSGCVWPGAKAITCTVTSIMTTTPYLSTLIVTTSATYSGTLANNATVAPIGNVVDPHAGDNNAGPVEVVVQTAPIEVEHYIYLPLVLRNYG